MWPPLPRAALSNPSFLKLLSSGLRHSNVLSHCNRALGAALEPSSSGRKSNPSLAYFKGHKIQLVTVTYPSELLALVFFKQTNSRKPESKSQLAPISVLRNHSELHARLLVAIPRGVWSHSWYLTHNELDQRRFFQKIISTDRCKASFPIGLWSEGWQWTSTLSQDLSACSRYPWHNSYSMWYLNLRKPAFGRCCQLNSL